MAADLTKSIVHILEQLTITGGLEAVNVSSVSVTVPAVTDPDIGSVDETVAGVALGDAIVAWPDTALETNARFQQAYVHATDTVRFVFGSLGGNITGGEEVFTVVHLDFT